jgi:KDO2-lipid IV(A) lauroyltransferase
VYAVYEHFCRVAVEIAHIPRKVHRWNWKRRVDLFNTHEAMSAFLDDRPTIVVTGHFGNWEVAGHFIGLIGIGGTAIARDLDNPFLDRFLRRYREYSGQTIVSKNGEFDKIKSVLTSSQVLITVGDQSAGPRGCFVDFFGRPASTHKSIALLAMQYDAAIIVGFAVRNGNGLHYSMGCSSVIDPRDFAEGKEKIVQITQAFTKELETAIRANPEQYLWLHGRWKHQPARGKGVIAA